MSVALGDAAAKPVVRLATPAAEELPTPSPDGRWLAYQTNASGTAETRVAPLTDLTAFVQVSSRGGSPIRWNRDGSTLYFKDGDTVAAIDIGPRGPVLTSRRALFSVPRDWVAASTSCPTASTRSSSAAVPSTPTSSSCRVR